MIDLPSTQDTINGLEKSLGRLEWWLAIATFLVVVGLVFEYWYELREAIGEFKKNRACKHLVKILGGVLITVGVAGELLIQRLESRQETQLSVANEAVYTALNQKASDADAAAQQAKQKTAHLTEVAECERLARVKLEQDVAWRRLTKEQQTKIASQIKPFSSQNVILHYNLNDLEADSFASDIALTLRQAKWKTVFEPMVIMAMREGPIPLGKQPVLDTGILINSTHDEASRRFANLILSLLVQNGFDTTRRPDDDPRPGTRVFIFVQHRPEGPQGEAKLRHVNEATSIPPPCASPNYSQP